MKIIAAVDTSGLQDVFPPDECSGSRSGALRQRLGIVTMPSTRKLFRRSAYPKSFNQIIGQFESHTWSRRKRYRAVYDL